MSLIRAHLFVSGRVQGVFYRDQTQRQANARGVAGWVRNLPDGRVEVVLEGEETAVQEIIAWCHRGPPNAYVTDVRAALEAIQGEPGGFRVRY